MNLALLELLLGQGYREYPPPFGAEEVVGHALFKRRLFQRPLVDIDSSASAFPCATNNHKVAVDVLWTQVTSYHSTNASLEVTVVGQLPSGHWHKVMVYALAEDELLQILPTLEVKLVNAWKFLYGSG